ncbi:MAG: DUF58 domain-containing protein [Clostridia bacterium]|nr:MAG: DUF58 domain-containing protein [Clostridia bacterium]
MRLSSWIAFFVWILSLAAAVITGRDLFYNTFYLVTLVLIGSWLWARQNIRNLEIRRRVRPPRSQVGKFIEESFEVVNRSWMSKLWLEILDQSDLPGHHVSRVLVSLKRNKPVTWNVKTPCFQRGRYHLGPILLRSGDPLGIFEITRQIPQERYILIHPATYDIPGFHLPPGRTPGGRISHYRTHYLTTNVATVRDYVPGDSFNRIHWPSTARTGRLIVKEFELDPTSDIWLLLDLDADWHVSQPWEAPDMASQPVVLQRYYKKEPPLVPGTLEYATAAAASIAQRYLAERRAVGLITYSPHRQVLQIERSHRQFSKILETLAVVTPSHSLPLERILSAEGPAMTRTTTLVVITPSANNAWVSVLRDYRQRGILSTVVLVAASTFGPLPSYRPVLSELWAGQTPTYLLRRGVSLSTSLSRLAPPE